jgi:hypothetical protein
MSTSTEPSSLAEIEKYEPKELANFRKDLKLDEMT